MQQKIYVQNGGIRIALLLIGLLLVYTVRAQERRLEGTVLSAADNMGIPGARIAIKGSVKGTTADENGNFSLYLPQDASVLVISSLGFSPQEVQVGSQLTLTVKLEESANTLNEVVVTGYSSQTKKDIIGAVAVVKTRDLLVTPAGNIQQQLQGRVAGVTISGNGSPNSLAKVRIRGFNSFTVNDPLYIIDGVPTSNVSNLNPQDIESLQVLKDASAASIYGARASNGVVLITTKQGKAGEPTLTVESYYGLQSVNRFYDLLNPTEYGQLLWTQFRNANLSPSHPQYGRGAQPLIPEYLLAGPLSGVSANSPAVNPDAYNIDFSRPIYQIVPSNAEGTNWFKEIFRTAPMQAYQISAAGGTNRGTYALGFNYFDQQGTLIHTRYKRYSVRANAQANIKNFLRIGENIQISYEDRQGNENRGEAGAITQATKIPSIVPVYDINGGFAGTRGSGLGDATNPVADLFRNRDNRNYAWRLLGNVYAELDLLKSLTLRSSFGVDYTTAYLENFVARTYERFANISSSAYTERNDWANNWTWTNTATFQKTFANEHALKVIVGSEAIQSIARGVGGSRLNLQSDAPDARVLLRGQAAGQDNFSYGNRSSLFSVFGKVEYSYQDKYLLNLSTRRDGSSRFGANNRYGWFPSVGVGWRLSREPFLEDLSWLTDLKFRATWGILGNQLIDLNNPYNQYRSTPNNSSYDLNGTGLSVVQGFDLDRLGNPNTRWEKTITSNGGLDVALYDGSLTMSIDYYFKYTKDLLVLRQAADTEPQAAQPLVNLGAVENRGIDLSIGKKGKVGTDFRYDVMLTGTAYRNKVVRISGSGTDIFQGGLARVGNFVARTVVGQPFSMFYGYVIDGFYNNASELNDGVNQVPIRKKIGGWRLKDLNGDKVVNDQDRTFIGNPNPKFQLGFNLTAMYHNFDFTAFLFWNYGNDIFHYNRYFTDFNISQGNRSRRMLEESWTPDLGSSAKLPILDISDLQSNNIVTDYFVESGSFLRAKTLQLGYNFAPLLAKKLGLKKCRLYAQAQNLFTITKYSGMDPDLSIQGFDSGMGVDEGVYPNARQFLVGMILSF